VSIQAAFQKYTDNAVSKTVNFKHEATEKDVEEVFLYAYELGCKGVTVYRDGTRKNQVITSGTSAKNGAVQVDPTEASPGSLHPRPRPAVTHGHTYKTKTGCGNLYVNVNADNVGLCEIFTQMGKSGGCPASNSEAVPALFRCRFEPALIPSPLPSNCAAYAAPFPHGWRAK